MTGALFGVTATFVSLATAFGVLALPASVYVIAWGGTVLMLSGTRLFVRSLADWLRRERADADRVLIYGAGVGGELVLREIRSNRELAKNPVGFIDDDPLRRGMTIHGVRVLGGVGELERLVAKHHIKAVVVSTGKISSEHQERLIALARAHAFSLYRLQIAMVPFEIAASQVRA